MSRNIEREKLIFRDESDEDDCKTIVMKENYSKTIAPFIYNAEKDENLPARVNVSMSVIDVINIKEVDHTYNLKFKLRLQWFDYRWQFSAHGYCTVLSVLLLAINLMQCTVQCPCDRLSSELQKWMNFQR